jgi:FixJ family two-component response regulator
MRAPSRPFSVAIVDDEASVREGLRRLCSAMGMNPTVHASGHDFIASLAGEGPGPDCLLLDAHMPEMTGLEVHQHLVSRGVHVPTVVFTADDATELRNRYLAAGVNGYLRKPITDDQLLTAIERAVGENGERSGNGAG